MGLGTIAKRKTDAPTAEEILAQLDAVGQAFRDDPELVAAQRQLEEAQRRATRAQGHLSTCQATRQAIAVQILKPDLVARAQRIKDQLATIPAKRAALTDRRSDLPAYQRQFDEGRLREFAATLAAELANVQRDMDAVTKLPAEATLLATVPPLRHAYRAADAAVTDAAAAATATVEPLGDARYALNAVRPTALARVQPRLRQIYAIWVSRYVAIAETASQETAVGHQVWSRLAAILGPGALENVAMPFFTEAGAGGTSPFQTWKDSLRTRVTV